MNLEQFRKESIERLTKVDILSPKCRWSKCIIGCTEEEKASRKEYQDLMSTQDNAELEMGFIRPYGHHSEKEILS